jgi:Domain of unknown function (DUF4919)
MKKYQVVFIVFLLLSASIFFMGSTFGEEKQSYAVLLQRVKAFDRTVDFRALRLSYSETPEYNPYSNNNAHDLMFSALRDKRYEDALLAAQSILEKNYVDLDAHFVCRIAYKNMGNSEKNDYHQFVLQGLVDSIYASGDGSTPEKAPVVIDVKEEYFLLNTSGLEAVKNSSLRLGNHDYDRMEVKNKKTGEKMILFFNIDIPYGWLIRKMKQ